MSHFDVCTFLRKQLEINETIRIYVDNDDDNIGLHLVSRRHLDDLAGRLSDIIHDVAKQIDSTETLPRDIWFSFSDEIGEDIGEEIPMLEVLYQITVII